MCQGLCDLEHANYVINSPAGFGSGKKPEVVAKQLFPEKFQTNSIFEKKNLNKNAIGNKRLNEALKDERATSSIVKFTPPRHYYNVIKSSLKFKFMANLGCYKYSNENNDVNFWTKLAQLGLSGVFNGDGTFTKLVALMREHVDNIIGNTQVNFVRGSKSCILEFVSYDQFKNIEFIAEGGFSKIYKAIWVNGPIHRHFYYSTDNIVRKNNYTVVLKKLNNSKNITSKELNELKVYNQISSDNTLIFNDFISEYFGITQDPITKDMIIIMPYYELVSDLGISRFSTDLNNDNEKYMQ
ncbi:hypothetical protein RhiirC2_770512 [Rhizophagus irregularis]|uniref:Protein kinase domain-containing protein n=1 Tax=Rhizophagus irregularis TaxID=588596 RepID=A0A2N1NWB7_9GLOM|nr:hypothetical protein RhiirC2_770512 [Rhizophagus irregularis]